MGSNLRGLFISAGLVLLFLLAVSALFGSDECDSSARPIVVERGDVLQEESVTAEPRYVRLRITSKRTIYVELRGKEMRIAATPAGLKTATPIQAEDADVVYETSGFVSATFSPVELPVPKVGCN